MKRIIFIFTIILSVLNSTTVAAENNIAPYAAISSYPYIGANVKYLVDGVVDDASENTLIMSAPLAPRIGGGVHLSFEFKFNTQIDVSGINIFQCSYRNGRSPAKIYRFDGDEHAEGSYAINLVHEKSGKGGNWFKYSFDEPKRLSAIKFQSVEWDKARKGPNYGVPAICEIEIMSRNSLPLVNREGKISNNAPKLDNIAGTSKPINYQKGKNIPWYKQYPRGIFSTMWMFWSPGKPYAYENNLIKLKKISDVGANRLWLYPAATADVDKRIKYTTPETDFNLEYSLRRKKGEKQWTKKDKYRIYPFPSDVVLGFETNILKKLSAQVHEENLGLIVNQRLLPYGLKGWDFPRVSDTKNYPCILSAHIVEESAKKLVRELILSDVDGVALGGDEFFFHSHTGIEEEASAFCQAHKTSENITCKPTCEYLYNKKTGFNIPLKPGNGLNDRKWQLFEYTRLAELFSTLAKEINDGDAGRIVTSLFRPGEVKRATYGVAYDIMGTTGAIEEMSSDPLWANDNFNGHYYIANETKKLMAATKGRNAVVTLQTTPHYDKRAFRRPIMVYGSAISALMHGAAGINYYKDEYIFTNTKDSPQAWVEKVFQLISHLDEQGLNEYRPPSTIAVLYSRASEDWWQLNYPNDPVRANMPVIYQNAIMEVLFRNGVPYGMYYMDQPDTLAEVSDAELIIIPFAYSMSDEAWKIINNAQAKGAKVIWLGGAGETDENGIKREKPLYNAATSNNVSKLNLDLNNYNDVSSKIMASIRNALSDKLPLNCTSSDKLSDVECGMLSNGKDYIIFMQNWGEQKADITISSSIQNGNYSCESLNLESISQVLIGGSRECEVDKLREFSVQLEDGEVRIITIKAI